VADVQLEHGYLRVANSLWEAITYAPFSGTQLSIVTVIVRLTFGWSQDNVRISHRELAEKSNRAFTGGFRRALDELLREGAIVEIEPSIGQSAAAYAINKNFEEWGKFSVAAKLLARLYGQRPIQRRRSIARPQALSAVGYVYYIRAGKYVKIGYSSDPWRRLSGIQSSRPNATLRAVEAGTRDLERERHAAFVDARLESNREWFRWTPEIAEHVAGLGALTGAGSSAALSIERAPQGHDNPPTVPPQGSHHAPMGAPSGPHRGIVTRAKSLSTSDVRERKDSRKTVKDRKAESHARAPAREEPALELALDELLKVIAATPPLVEFFRDFYGESSADRQLDVAQQLATLATGGSVTDDSTQAVKAYSVDRLARKATEVLVAPVRNPDSAILILLRKLGDTTDVTEDLFARERETIAAEDREGAERARLADRWAAEHPREADEIRRRLEEQFPGDPNSTFVAQTRRWGFIAEAARAAERDQESSAA
jgi:phage replication O-like protein O